MSDDNTRLCKCGHMEYHHRPECGYKDNWTGPSCYCEGFEFDAAKGER